jgi:glycosyltransferase involved in cell wall biosynthesis
VNTRFGNNENHHRKRGFKLSLPLRVLYLDHTARWSGGEVALFRTLVALKATSIIPIVLLAEEGPFADKLREAAIETHVLPLSENVREVRKDTLGISGLLRYASLPLSVFHYAKQIAQFARYHNCVLIHCNSLKSDIYGVIAGRQARLPTIWHIRDNITVDYLPRPAVIALRTLAARLPQAVYANSESTLKTVFPNRNPLMVQTGVVYDGLDGEQLTNSMPSNNGQWKNRIPVFGLVGRITPWKGQHVFLEAAKILKNKGLSAKFQIIGAPLFGEESYESQIKEQAEELGDSVEFLGFRSDMINVLSQLDILVHASTLPEPFGQVVTEGMAVGLPIIASRGGGVCEIIKEGATGILTPMGDAPALAQAMQDLLQNPQYAHTLGSNAYLDVRERFTATQTATQLQILYNQLLSL